MRGMGKNEGEERKEGERKKGYGRCSAQSGQNGATWQTPS
jgi:hypothetical protein